MYLSLDYLKFLPKAMKLPSMKQQSMRKSMPMMKGAIVLSCGIVIKDHGVISHKQCSWRLPGSLADFFQKFIMEAVFDQRFTFFVDYKTASGWNYDPKYLHSADRMASRSKYIPYCKAVLVLYITSRQVLIASLQWTTWTFLQFTKFLHSIITYIKIFNSNKQMYMGLIQQLYYLFTLSSWQYILSSTLDFT